MAPLRLQQLDTLEWDERQTYVNGATRKLAHPGGNRPRIKHSAQAFVTAQKNFRATLEHKFATVI